MKEKIGVIGAGPAGIMAAGIAAREGKEVTLIEKNERIGKKLFITGKGRCNITNNAPIEDFFDNVMKNKNFLYSSFYTFNNNDVMNLLESYGLRMKVERGNRVFPESDKSSDVLKTFQKFLDSYGVNVLLKTTVNSIHKEDDLFIVETAEDTFKFNKLIITTGGKSYPLTGSTGDGYTFAESFGHTVTKIRPSLVPIELKEDWIKDLQGLSLKNVKIEAYSKKRLIYDEFGEMIFTHYGISGPIILSMSNYLFKYLNDGINFKIDLKPALDEEKLDFRILRDFEENINRSLKNSLDDLLPQKLIPLVIHYSGIDPEKKVHQITKEERQSLLSIVKGFPCTFKEFRPIEEAIVTSGGVSVKEINPSTMESKIISGLFFAGEVIDVDALTGGYNLQIAYSTGYLAGFNA